MGNCQTKALPPVLPVRPKEKTVFKDLFTQTDQSNFKIAVQNCVSISAGVASKNVTILEVTSRASRNEGVDVIYTVSDVFELSSADDLRNHIDIAISRGKFTSLLREHGFPTAVAIASITAVDLSTRGHSQLSERSQLLVQVTQNINGIRLPSKSIQNMVKDFASHSGGSRKHLQVDCCDDNYVSPLPGSHSRSNGGTQSCGSSPRASSRRSALKDFSFERNKIEVKFEVPLAVDNPKIIPEDETLTASNSLVDELDYTTPAFRSALLQSIAASAGVPIQLVSVLEISPIHSGTRLDIMYTITQNDRNTSLLTNKLDQAVHSGVFRASLKEEGYASLAASPVTLVSESYTIRQTISIISLLPGGRTTGSELGDNLRTERDEIASTSTTTDEHRNEGSMMALCGGTHVDTDSEDSSMKMVSIAAPEQTGASESIFLEDIKRFRRSQDIGGDTSRASHAELMKINEALLAVKRRHGKVPITSDAKGNRSEMTSISTDSRKVGYFSAPSSPKGSGRDKWMDGVISSFQSPKKTEELRIAALNEEVSRLLNDDNTDLHPYGRLLKIEEVHQLRENEKHTSTAETKMKMIEVHRQKKEQGLKDAADADRRKRDSFTRINRHEEDVKHMSVGKGGKGGLAVRTYGEGEDAFDLLPLERAARASKEYSQFSSFVTEESVDTGDSPPREEEKKEEEKEAEVPPQSVWEATTHVWHAFGQVGTRQSFS